MTNDLPSRVQAMSEQLNGEWLEAHGFNQHPSHNVIRIRFKDIEIQDFPLWVLNERSKWGVTCIDGAWELHGFPIEVPLPDTAALTRLLVALGVWEAPALASERERRLEEALAWIARIPCKENPPCSSRMDYACDSCTARVALEGK